MAMIHARLPGSPIIRCVAALAAIIPWLAGCEPGGTIQLPSASTGGIAASAPDLLAATAPASMGSVPHDAEELTDALIKAVNAERSKLGLPPVTLSPTLCDIADSYAMRLVSKDFFAHVDPNTGSTVARRAIGGGYAFFKVGENLAAGQKTVTTAMKAWIDSPTHRANILDPDFTEIGIAIRDGGRYGRYWVQEFGRPLGH